MADCIARHLLPVMLVYPQRTAESHRYLLQRIHSFFGFWWTDCSRHCRWYGRPRWLSFLEMVGNSRPLCVRNIANVFLVPRIFIIEGALTIVMAFAGYALLPNYPSNTAFLSAEETAMAQWRLDRENDGVADEVNESVFVGLKQAFTDLKVVSYSSPQVLRSNRADVTLAAARVHPNMCRCLHELHILLPIHCQDARVSSRRDTPTDRSSLLPSLFVLGPELVAFWTLRRTLLPYRRCMCHLCGRADRLNDDV
jgi:hypothetical protein